MPLVAVVMAGGLGQRFWPKSRNSTPKQFLRLVGERTLLQATVDRISRVIPLSDVLVVTGEAYRGLVLEQLPALPVENLILEPVGRDTAPCIGLASLFVERKYPDGTMIVLPSDHAIEKENAFLDLIEAAAVTAERTGGLVTLGITPTRPETGYGYLKRGRRVGIPDERRGFSDPGAGDSGLGTAIPGPKAGVYRVDSFTEKPDPERARLFLQSGDYLWNSGIFIWKVSAIRDMIRRHLPNLHRELEIIKGALGTRLEREVIRSRFPALDRASIDKGVVEKAGEVYVLPADVGWDDVGSWLALERHFPVDEDGNLSTGRGVFVDSTSCIIDSPQKTVVTLGVSKLVVVETDGVMLICHRDKVQQLKKAIDRLKEEGLDQLL